MAANSIAKLAVVITGDSSPLAQSMNDGAQHIRTFASHAEHAGHEGALGALASGLKIGVQGMHAFEGSTRGIIHTLHNLAGPAGIALVAAAGIGFLTVKMTEAADAAREARNKINEDFAKAFEGATGNKLDIKPEETVSEAWKDLKASVADFFATLGENSGIVDGLISLMKELTESVKSWADFFKTAEQKQREALAESRKAQIKGLEEQAKKREEQRKKDEEDARRQLEDIKRRADAITKAMRTPAEVMRDTFGELKELLDLGAISWETFNRGAQKALDDFAKAKEQQKQVQDAARPVAALDRFSSGAFSAIQAASRERDKQVAIQQQQLDIEREQKKELEQINAQLAGKPLTALKIGRLHG